MDIFHYDRFTGEYRGQGKADPDPKNEGRWLMPGASTREAPPDEQPGFARVFADGVWALVEDHRGETWWDSDGVPVIISTLGDPASDGLSKTEPVIAFEDLKKKAIDCLEEEAETYRKIIAGNISPLRAAELADKARTADRMVNGELVSDAHLLEAKRELVSLGLAESEDVADPMVIAPIWQGKAAALIDARSRINVIYRDSLKAFQNAQTLEELSVAVDASRATAATALQDFKQKYG